MQFSSHSSHTVPDEYKHIRDAVDGVLEKFCEDMYKTAQDLDLSTTSEQLTLLTSCCSCLLSSTLHTLVSNSVPVEEAIKIFHITLAHAEKSLGESGRENTH
jgi:hypothetical protein